MTHTAEPKGISRMPRWLKAVFALSLAGNLAVVGIMVGAALREGRPGPHRHKAPPPAAADAIGAVMYRSFDDAERRALRRLASGKHGDIVERRLAELNVLLEVIQQDPLDADRLRAEIDAQSQSAQAFRSSMHEVWIAELQKMTPAERAGFAEKVRDHIARFRKPREDRP
ncbi:periplasmic heavy metal sensor [Rhodobacteraceae bacterium R_SAG7]|jgi:Spy/CpxP family protein refolding chaperone|uniref:periplasmic heavy metal sensor n=1 Tax=Tritonibacter mobilis TaxID=379347 RepID=UPI001445BC4F|nr:periplasmic heavy metal sensor [Tritonibacter mobilis]NKW78380.1 periplasmic heavy metal sensor [Rhodobacteraceae bacterium R_SAG7]